MQFQEPIIASNFVRIVSPDSNTDPGWLFWLLGLESAIRFMKRVSAGTSLQNLPMSFFKEWIIPYYPSIEEQRYIATVLDSVEEVIMQTEKVIINTKYLSNALIHELLKKDHPIKDQEWNQALSATITLQNSISYKLLTDKTGYPKQEKYQK